MAFTGYAHDKLARQAVKIMVDIDEAEIRKMRTTIKVPVVADAGAFLREMEKQSSGAELADPDTGSAPDAGFVSSLTTVVVVDYDVVVVVGGASGV